MNKLKLNYLDGIPFEWDDIDFMQDSIRNAFKQFFRALSIQDDDSFFLKKPVITNPAPNIVISDGWFCWKGEVCYIPSFFATANPLYNIYIQYDDTIFDANGDDFTEGGNAIQTYQKLQTKIVYQQNPPAGDYYIFSSAKTLIDRIATNLENSFVSSADFQSAIDDLQNQIDTINSNLVTAGAYTNIAPSTLTIKGLNGASIVETVVAVAQTSFDVARIPAGTTCFFKYKIDRKTVTLMFLIQFPITADNHSDYFRITLPNDIKNIASPTMTWGQVNNNVTAVKTAKGIMAITAKSDHLELVGFSLDSGVQYSSPGFSYNYTDNQYMTGGLSIALTGQITYQIN